MNPGRIDIQGKLPRGALEMYLQIDACAKQENIRFLVVGAFARELILVHVSMQVRTGHQRLGLRYTTKNMGSISSIEVTA